VVAARSQPTNCCAGNAVSTAVAEGQTVEAYYKARCSVDARKFINVPDNFRLIPGMTLEADLKVGTRSVAMYLKGGMLRGFTGSMREP
jgi:hemolysin D